MKSSLSWFRNRWLLVENTLRLAELVRDAVARLITAEQRVADQNKLIVELQEQVDRLERDLRCLWQRPTAPVIDFEDDEDFRIAVQRVVKEFVEDELRITVDFV